MEGMVAHGHTLRGVNPHSTVCTLLIHEYMST